MSNSFYEAVKDRRSFYAIGKERILPDEEIIKLIQYAVKYAPSAFNCQSSRVLILLGGGHDKLWDLTGDILRGVIPAEIFLRYRRKNQIFSQWIWNNSLF